MTPHSTTMEATLSNQVRVSVITSISQGARDYQEDAVGSWSGEGLGEVFAVVADGAGGHGGGAEASQATIASAAASWKKRCAGSPTSGDDFLSNWMADAHGAVVEESKRIERSARACVVACVVGQKAVHWVHAGDSRLLRFYDGRLVERTRDDSVVQVLFERGDITEDEMGTHPDQARLLQSLGGEDPPRPRTGHAPLVVGDALLLCSDGFWEYLKPAELEKLVATPAARRQQALDDAVAESVRRGGERADNATAVMILLEGQENRLENAIRWFLFLLCFVLIVSILTKCAADAGFSIQLDNVIKSLGFDPPSLSPAALPTPAKHSP